MLGWATFARVVRGPILSVKSMEFVEAARAQGAGDLRIIFRHVLPNSMAPVYVSVAMAIGGAIATEAALSFLGIGIQPPDSSWGLMISDALNYLAGGNWWWLPSPASRWSPPCSASSRSATACATPPTRNSRNRHGGSPSQVKDLSTHFFTHAGVVKAVNGVSFTLDRGETLGIVGESGSGKTVAALSLMRLIPDPPGKVVEGSLMLGDATCAP